MLSSVRRLVSSELPRHMRTGRRADPGALVLTDSQRVEGKQKPEPTPKPDGPKRVSLEERIAELEAAVSGSAEEWEPDGSEDQAQHTPDRIVYKSSRDIEPSSRRRSLRLSEIALIETGPANESMSEEASESEEADVEFRHERETPIDLVEDTLVEDTPVEDMPVEYIDDAIDEFDAELAEAVAASVAATEAPIDEELAEEPDLGLAHAPEEIEVEPEDEEVPAAAQAVDSPDIDDDADEIDDDLEEIILSEEALRPIVAALLREELQGQIGERITRNVRKLVRQEIQRALAVKELD